MSYLGKDYDDKMLNENLVNKPLSEPKVDTFIDGILQDYHEDIKDSSDEASMASRDDIVNNDVVILNIE